MSIPQRELQRIRTNPKFVGKFDRKYPNATIRNPTGRTAFKPIEASNTLTTAGTPAQLKTLHQGRLEKKKFLKKGI